MIALVRYGFLGYKDTSVLISFAFLIVATAAVLRAQLPDLRHRPLPAYVTAVPRFRRSGAGNGQLHAIGFGLAAGI